MGRQGCDQLAGRERILGGRPGRVEARLLAERVLARVLKLARPRVGPWWDSWGVRQGRRGWSTGRKAITKVDLLSHHKKCELVRCAMELPNCKAALPSIQEVRVVRPAVDAGAAELPALPNNARRVGSAVNSGIAKVASPVLGNKARSAGGVANGGIAGAVPTLPTMQEARVVR